MAEQVQLMLIIIMIIIIIIIIIIVIIIILTMINLPPHFRSQGSRDPPGSRTADLMWTLVRTSMMMMMTMIICHVVHIVQYSMIHGDAVNIPSACFIKHSYYWYFFMLSECDIHLSQKMIGALGRKTNNICLLLA